MKTPDEIKKGLECCRKAVDTLECPQECPYYKDDCDCGSKPYQDCVAYIQQLEAENAEKDVRIQQLEKRAIHLEALNLSNLTTITMQERTRARLQERISQLEAQVPRWIPVEERLPEQDTLVLVGGYGEVASGFYHEKHGLWITHAEIDFTHWMPLPEPPKEDTPC
jgi:hypothetical protein